MSPDRLTYTDVQRMVADMKNAGLARGTIERELVALRQVLDHAGVDRNPTSDRRVKLPRKIRRLKRLPSGADIAAIHASLPDRVPLLLLLEHTGMRVGEAADLRWEHIDYKRDRLLVQDSKSPAGTRWVTHLADTPPFPERPEGVDATFKVFSPSPMSLTAAMWHAWKRGEAPLYSAHDLRHLHASRLLHEHTLSPAEIAARLGHTDAGVTLRAYIHVVPPDS